MKKILITTLLFFGIFNFGQEVKRLKLKNYIVKNLSDSLAENSTLEIFQGKLFTLNDSGNSSEIFEISKQNGRVLRTISTQLPNKDWEALTSDNQHFYIGDFGNNGGSRKDLVVYKIPFKNEETDPNTIQEIPFFYPEQTDFSFKNLNTNFDAEAMIFHNGKIHIFTKEWQSKAVSHYTLNPNISEKQPAQKLEFFKTNFVITDASYYDKKLFLLGYTKTMNAFLHIFEEDEKGLFFNGKHTKYKLGNMLKIGQVEGISVDENGVYISAEHFRFPLKSVPQRLFFIPKNNLDSRF